MATDKSKEAMKLALEGAANYIDALGGDSRKYRQALAEQPAQRTWVGLTDEEITDIWAEASPYYHEDDFARAIEAKLKEKNT